MISSGIAANLLPWSLQVAAVVAVASLLPWIFRLDVAGARYAYWRGVAILCLALPWLQPYRPAHQSGASRLVVVGDLVVHSADTGSRLTSGADWGSLAFGVIVLGILLRLAWLAFGLIRLQRLRRRSSESASARLEWDDLCPMSTRAEIRFAPEVQQPVTFGVRRPVVLLPEGLRTQSPDVQRAVIGHELLHVQRRDWAWLILEELGVCLFWFHPSSWWLASRIQHAREEVVDELAVLLTGRRKAYVEALLAFSDATSVVPTAAFARRRHLFRRIALVSKEDVMSPRRLVATCAVMALIVVLGCWYSVSAFPLHAANQSNSGQQMGPGPLELKAHTVTPENPVPRRVHYEEPLLPDWVTSARGTVGVKVTLDDVGRVAESRAVEISIATADFDISMTAVDSNGLRGFANSRSPSTAAGRQTVDAFIESALASVRQWRYDPPFEAPLTFTVQVRIAKGPEIMAFKPSSENGALRVGGPIKAPKKVKDVRPVYPPLALEANVTGVVIVEARIGTDGHVEEAHVLRSIPLLDQAALDAVKQWEFIPTLVNGQPTPIIMTVTINFAQ